MFVSWFTRGLGAARTEDVKGAREASGRLVTLHHKTAVSGQHYWAVLVDAMRRTVDAWTLWAEGDRSAALEAMREAAEVEDSVDKHPVTPGAARPAQELLGEMLLAADKPQEALAAFETELTKSPNLDALPGGLITPEKSLKMALGDRHE